MNTRGGFDSIARVYDTMAYIVFGNDLRRAQQTYLNRLPTEGRVLIIGGGTGWILKEVLRKSPELRVDYVEASEKMISLAKDKTPENNYVNFIHGTEVSIPMQQYDCIITNFFLDVFSGKNLLGVMGLFRQRLRTGGIWLCTDFRATSRMDHKFLIWLMHLFFRMFASLESKALLDFRPYFAQVNMELEVESEYRNGLIFSAVYRPSE
ncbi:MAG: hypothetical protein Roseis2KO_29000 [Roseivirga sp.]